MKEIRVLMIDDNINLINMVKEYLKDDEEVKIVLEAHDGNEGIKLAEKTDDYDVMILDLIMPIKDGLYVLEEMKKREIEKPVIVATSYNDPTMIRTVSEIGASYFILKPFDLSDLKTRILKCFDDDNTPKLIDFKKNNLQITVSKILHELGIPSHIKGYQYIRDGIEIIYNKGNRIDSITKDLYPALADRFGTTSSRVERAIRHAIEVSWNRGNWDVMEEIFGHSVDIDRAKPTNSEFIVTIADKLKLEGEKIGF